ncbi:hypothetical protein AB0H83_50020 [Dactylosporangium sp. NPDC050688]|uniref:hypothetical protein n=1 Tax=Dactylosporangium sp. NPDC050688 TaxID=3157217 RepID=UPI003407068D
MGRPAALRSPLPVARPQARGTGRVPVLTTLWRLLVRVDASTFGRADRLGRAPACPHPSRPRRRTVAVDDKVQRGARLPAGPPASASGATGGVVHTKVVGRCMT